MSTWSALPGARKIRNLTDNLGALDVTLSAAERAEISTLFPLDTAAGTRYSEAVMKLVNA